MSIEQKLDLLLIHVPKLNNFYNPFGYFVMNNVIAWGLFSIADWATKNGYRAEIIHLGAEILFNKKFRLGDYIQARSPKLVGMSLHWHYQTYDVLELARRIKQRFPNIYIVIGGYTATYFADEILSSQLDIDFIVRGEAEVPVVYLLEAIDGKRQLETVPNLSFRQNNSIRHNPITFVADKAFLEKLVFCRFELLKSYEVYLKYLSYPVYLRSYPRFLNYSILTAGRMEGYMVPVGRGCPVNCTYCGGSQKWSANYFARNKTTLIPPDKVLLDIARAKEIGIKALYFSFDPYPLSDYYPRLFSLIREANLKFFATFESYALPTSKFIQKFTEAFGKDKRNQIVLSPETGSEELRAKHKGYFYSNSELFNALDEIERANLSFQISYSLGLPGESEETLKETLSLWRTIAKKYKNLITQTATLIDFDPGSPAEQRGEVPKYTFDSIYKMHKESHKDSYTGWTYLPQRYVPSQLLRVSSDRCYLERYKCRYFCSYMKRFKIPYPLNKILCSLLGIFFRLIKRPLNVAERFEGLTHKG